MELRQYSNTKRRRNSPRSNLGNETSGMMGMFTGMVKKHIQSGTEQALQSIKQEAESNFMEIALDIFNYIFNCHFSWSFYNLDFVDKINVGFVLETRLF